MQKHIILESHPKDLDLHGQVQTLRDKAMLDTQITKLHRAAEF